MQPVAAEIQPEVVDQKAGRVAAQHGLLFDHRGAATAGAGLAFLWFNTHPAQVFMGDVGALALGGALGTIAVITRQEIVLGIMGGIFVAEALSVMLQVASFRLTGKRLLTTISRPR